MSNNEPDSKIISVKFGVTPTKERRQHNGGVVCEAIRVDRQSKTYINRYRAVWESPLDVYFDRKVISKPEYRAGLRFHRAYYGSVMCRSKEMHLTSQEQASLKPTPLEGLLKEAYAALPLDTLGVVVNVCGYNEPVRNEVMLEKLRKGLGHLAVKWNMAAIEVCDPKQKQSPAQE